MSTAQWKQNTDQEVGTCMHIQTLTNTHTYHAWCHLRRGRKEPCKPSHTHSHFQTMITHTHTHTHIHTRHDTWDRNSILTSYNQTKRKKKKRKERKKEKKDHCEAKRWTINSELLRGRSKHFGNFATSLCATLQQWTRLPTPLCYSSPPSPHSQVHICYFPLGLFSLSSLVSPWGHNGLSKTIRGMRNRCGNS